MPDPFATTVAGVASVNPFGTVNQPAVAPNGAALDNQQQQAAPEPLLDINDPLLTSETLTAKEGDAFAQPPPPPDRTYRCKLSLRGVTQEDAPGQDITQFLAGGTIASWIPGVAKDKLGNTTGGFAKTLINVQVHDSRFPEYDGTYLQVPFKWMDTRTGQKGLSKIMTILTLAGKRPDGQPWVVLGQNYGPKTLMEIFLKFLAGEPEIMVRSEWSVSCEACGLAAKAAGTKYPNSIDGMQKFPQVPGKPGQYQPERMCDANRAHGYSKARAMAVQYFALEPVAGK